MGEKEVTKEEERRGSKGERKEKGEDGGGGVGEDRKELTGCESEDWHPTFGTLQLKQIAFPLPLTLSVLSSVYRQ